MKTTQGKSAIGRKICWLVAGLSQSGGKTIPSGPNNRQGYMSNWVAKQLSCVHCYWTKMITSNVCIMNGLVSRPLTRWKLCSLSISISSDSVDKLHEHKYMNVSDIFLYNISDCLKPAADLLNSTRNWGEILYNETVTHLHFHTNDQGWKSCLFKSKYSDIDTLFCVYQFEIHDTPRERNKPISDTRYIYRACSIKTPDLPSKNKQKYREKLISIIWEFKKN